MLSIIIFLLILSLLVLIHEFGHFLACKLQKIKVMEFALGFGPKIFGFKKGETLYRINPILFGGYVRPYGEGEYESSSADSFENQKAYKRLIVILAGIFMNFILAFVVYTIFLAFSSFRVYLSAIVPYNFPFGQQSTVIGIQPESGSSSPASKVLGEKNYVISSVDGKTIKDSQSLVDYVDTHKGSYIDFKVIDLATQKTKDLELYAREHPPKNEGSLGVVLTPIYELNFNNSNFKILSGVGYSLDLIPYYLSTLKSIFGVSIATHNPQVITSSLNGPVGLIFIIKAVQQQLGALGLVNLIGILSIGLAIMNSLPFPALDGGQAVFVLIEMLSRRKINARFIAITNNIGMILLIAFAVVVTINDINNFNVISILKHIIVR